MPSSSEAFSDNKLIHGLSELPTTNQSLPITDTYDKTAVFAFI